MIHILNGDAMVPAFRASGVPGRATVWREMLMEGPIPGALATREDWNARRDALAQRFGVSIEAQRSMMEEALLAIDEASPRGEIVLWFDDDWFCQANALYVLHRLARRNGAAVSAPPTGGTPHARGPRALAAAFHARERVSPARLALARRAWAAFAAPDPRAVEELLRGDLSAWPELRTGLLAHLARFPDVATGLDATERSALDALASGPVAFPRLFTRIAGDARTASLGIGDLQLAGALAEIASGPHPLVRLVSHAPESSPGAPPSRGRAAPSSLPSSAASWVVEATREGLEAAAGLRDRVAFRGIDAYRGGARLVGDATWRWDAVAAALVWK